MARIRTIKPEFFTSEDIVSLSPMARLLYIAIWCECDKEGRLIWKPKTFKMRYFPADECDIHALCLELTDASLVLLYGDGLAHVPKFAKHQHVNPRESASTLPAPDACPTRAPRVSTGAATVSDAQVGREGKGSSSVAKATGGKPPVNADEEKRELFDAGKSLLAEQGMPKAQCGSYIGKLAKDYGQPAALEAVRSAVVNRPMKAADYLKATCQKLKGERSDPITVPSKAADMTKEYLEAEMAREVVAPPANIRNLIRGVVKIA